MVVFIAERAVDGMAAVVAFKIGADVVATGAKVTRGTLVDVPASAFVGGQSIASRTRAVVGAGHIVAEAHADLIVLVHFALIDIVAGTVVKA